MKNLLTVLLFLIPIVILQLLPPVSPLFLCFLVSGFVFLLFIKIRVLAPPSPFPEITFLLVLGIILGPHTLGIVTERLLEHMEFVEELALAFFLFYASRHIKFTEIKKNIKTISLVFIFQTGFVFIASLMALRFFFKQLSFYTALPLAIIFSSKSPEITLGVIEETEKENTFIETVLGITVLKDLFIIFSIAIFLAFSAHTISSVSVLFVSIFSGILIGCLIILYLRFVERELPVFMTLITVFMVLIARTLGLYVLIISLVAGMVVENFSEKGDTALSELKYSLPFSLSLFFFLQGASYKFTGFGKIFVPVIILIALKFLLSFAGSLLGVILAKGSTYERRWLWSALISQSGLSLYFLEILRRTCNVYPEPIIICTVIFVELSSLIAPPVFKRAVVSSFKEE